jgi:hypothetical protein
MGIVAVVFLATRAIGLPPARYDDIHLKSDQFCYKVGKSLDLPFGEPVFSNDVGSFRVA